MMSEYTMEQVKKYIPKRCADKIADVVIWGCEISIELKRGYEFKSGGYYETVTTLKEVRELFKGGLVLDKELVLDQWDEMTASARKAENPNQFRKYVERKYQEASKEVKELLGMFGVMGAIEDALKEAAKRKEDSDARALYVASCNLQSKGQKPDSEKLIAQIVDGLAYERTAKTRDYDWLEDTAKCAMCKVLATYDACTTSRALNEYERTIKYAGEYYGSELDMLEMLRDIMAQSKKAEPKQEEQKETEKQEQEQEQKEDNMKEFKDMEKGEKQDVTDAKIKCVKSDLRQYVKAIYLEKGDDGKKCVSLELADCAFPTYYDMEAKKDKAIIAKTYKDLFAGFERNAFLASESELLKLLETMRARFPKVIESVDRYVTQSKGWFKSHSLQRVADYAQKIHNVICALEALGIEVEHKDALGVIETVEEPKQEESQKVEGNNMKTYTEQEIKNTIAKTYAYKCRSLDGVEIQLGTEAFTIKTTRNILVNGYYIKAGSIVLFSNLNQVKSFFKKDNVMSAHYCGSKFDDVKAGNYDFTSGKPFGHVCGGFYLDGVNVDFGKGVTTKEQSEKEKAIALCEQFKEVHDEPAQVRLAEVEGTINAFTKAKGIEPNEREALKKAGLTDLIISYIITPLIFEIAKGALLLTQGHAVKAVIHCVIMQLKESGYLLDDIKDMSKEALRLYGETFEESYKAICQGVYDAVKYSFEFTQEQRNYIHALYQLEQDEKQGLKPCSKDIALINNALEMFAQAPYESTEIRSYQDGAYVDFYDNETYTSIDDIKARYLDSCKLEENEKGYLFKALPLEVLEYVTAFDVLDYSENKVRLFLEEGYYMEGDGVPEISLDEPFPTLEKAGENIQLSLLECFDALGSERLALEDLGVKAEVEYIEKDSYAVEAYNALHGTNETAKDIKDFHPSKHYDLMVFGTPKKGAENPSTIWEVPRIIKELNEKGLALPSVIIWENVKGLMTASNIEETKSFYRFFDSMGYSVSYRYLNALEFGIPQNRARYYTVFLYNKPCFDFDTLRTFKPLPLEHYKDKAPRLAHKVTQGNIIDKIHNKDNYGRKMSILDDVAFCNTITTRQDQTPNAGLWKEGNGYRYITEKEALILQGLSFEQAQRIPNANTSGMNRKLYRLAGRAISKNVIQEILRALFKQGVL